MKNQYLGATNRHGNQVKTKSNCVTTYIFLDLASKIFLQMEQVKINHKDSRPLDSVSYLFQQIKGEVVSHI